MSDSSELPEHLIHDRSVLSVDDMITKPDPDRRETSNTASVQTNNSSESREARLHRRLKYRTTIDPYEEEHFNSVDSMTEDETSYSSEPPTRDHNARFANRATYKKPKKKARAPRKTTKSNTRPRHEAFFNAHLDHPVTDDNESLYKFRSKRESSESTEGSQLSQIPWSTGGSVVDKMKGLMICPLEPCEGDVIEHTMGHRKPITSMRVRGCAVTQPSPQLPNSIRKKRQQAPKDVVNQMTARRDPKFLSTSAAGATEEGNALKLKQNESSLPRRLLKAPIHASTLPALTVTRGSPNSDRSPVPTLDDRAYDMLKYLISLTCQPNEWIDFLGPNDYYTIGGGEALYSAGHRSTTSFMRAALYKIDDELTKTYFPRNTHYHNVRVIFHGRIASRPVHVTDVWKPFSDLHSLVRMNHTSIAQYAPELQFLWRSIVERAPHLTLPLNSARGIMPPPPRNISFVLFLIVTCAPRSELQAVLEDLTPNSDQFNAVQDCISDGLKALRHEHPVYEGVSTLQLTEIWARLNSMIQAACQDGGGEGDAYPRARGNGHNNESQRGIVFLPGPGKKRKADEFERGGMEMGSFMKPMSAQGGLDLANDTGNI